MDASLTKMLILMISAKSTISSLGLLLTYAELGKRRSLQESVIDGAACFCLESSLCPPNEL